MGEMEGLKEIKDVIITFFISLSLSQLILPTNSFLTNSSHISSTISLTISLLSSIRFQSAFQQKDYFYMMRLMDEMMIFVD